VGLFLGAALVVWLLATLAALVSLRQKRG
jgi:hypothetical protein